jgi:hypothetical protein
MTVEPRSGAASLPAVRRLLPPLFSLAIVVVVFWYFLGVLGTPLVLAAAALLWQRWRLAAALVALVPLKLFVELDVLKHLVERGRPGQTEPGAVLRHVPPAGPSFPSGHAIVVFGVAVLLAPYLRGPWRIVAFGLALLACVARVYLGAHNPLDVAAAANADPRRARRRSRATSNASGTASTIPPPMHEPPTTSDSQCAVRQVRLTATSIAIPTAGIIQCSRRRPAASAITIPIAVTADAIACPDG